MPSAFRPYFDQRQSLTKFRSTLKIKSHELCHINMPALLPENYLTLHQPLQI